MYFFQEHSINSLGSVHPRLNGWTGVAKCINQPRRLRKHGKMNFAVKINH